MRITRWGEYGVHCICYIAAQLRRGHATVPAAAVAQALDIDLEYTRQILQRLKKAGIIHATRGPSGGYRLVHSEHDLTLYEILSAAEGSTFEVICETKPIDSRCSDVDSSCGLQRIWRELASNIDAFLKTYTLYRMLEDPYSLGGFQQGSVTTIGRRPHDNGTDQNEAKS